MSGVWREVADRVHVLRHPVLDVNTTLVIGDGAALVVDTLSTPAQARVLAAAARRLTAAPWVLVNTHWHFDHAYGNAVLAEGQPTCDIWAHPETTAELAAQTPARLRALHDEWLPAEPELAAGLLEVSVLAPNRAVRDSADLDVGGRTVALRHFGRGHTAGDLVVHVPDAGVVIAGDLVEHGAPPSFSDSYPLEWPHTVAELLRLVTGPVVPGHGAVVDREFVREQHDELSRLAWLIRDGHADGADPRDVARQAPFGERAALPAVTRGYAELSGRA
ncbi:MAG: MBL fold metallo-hydrolase [Micromonosporaceae bacterium]|nr:MBL fold metallo-hydrolase [Micromonosporaceae bacterium]